MEKTSEVKKRVLVIGASGFIGKKLFSVGKNQESINLFGTSFNSDSKELLTLDVRDHAMVGSVIDQIQPSVIVYAVGIANVDRAEKERELTDDLNANALKHIANFFHKHFIYLSTHYVF